MVVYEPVIAAGMGTARVLEELYPVSVPDIHRARRWEWPGVYFVSGGPAGFVLRFDAGDV